MRAWLDGLLGRFTMYRLVLVVLGVLALYSIILDLLGWLTFGLPAIFASLLISLLVTTLVSWLLGLVFRVKVQLESSLISGLLIYFLFWPSLQAGELAGIALAAATASASKFLLAWRGRHIFNPAAIGAFLVSLTGLNIATWWTATPAMLWLLVPAAALVLYRSSKLIFAAIFIVTAATIIIVRLLSNGLALGAALSQPFASLPVLFFVGFMLSEPLTLPPRRYQQWLLAGLVAVLFSVPFQLGPVFSTPELALLIGNLLAFTVGQRGGLRLSFQGARQLTPTSMEYRFSAARPVRFAAGQYMELSLPHRKPDWRGSRRVFSLTTDPRQGAQLAFGLRLAEPSSSFKRELNSLKAGAVISATGVWGDFVLPAGRAPLLLMAAGVGITPFLSQLRHLQHSAAEHRDVVLLYVISSLDEFGYREELLKLTAAEGIRLLISAPEDPGVGEYLSTGYPSAEQLKTAVPDISARRSYASGSPTFVAHARSIGHHAGARKVHTDSFLGY
ncbi:FAD-dependent oxidoreductase [Psychromicrobium lacuslunae]|uniref:Oxidoreductase n=1 Tax=Psychromicrobium lacuslunae TaxID=1618207 RepID=A0A0D4BYY8_9MICC|nr:oxidoreductase [Psychromicrobium lacuslunae]AJT41360.1 oxidoreductase [Psychromicrobium lacuslunae]